jgi:serine/threonine protein kinase
MMQDERASTQEEENPFDFKSPPKWEQTEVTPEVAPAPVSIPEAPAATAGRTYSMIGLPAFESLWKISLAESSEGQFVRFIEFPVDDRGHRMIKRVREVSSLSNPYFVNVLEVGTTGFGFYYVEDAGDWQTLREALSYIGKFEETTIARLGCRLADALESMGTMGIQHRNLNPSTILVNFDLTEVKIRGLELSIRLQEGQTASGLAGGLPYMAPEVAERKAGSKSDLYSVGATLFEALTGRPPIAVSSPATLLHVVANLRGIKPSSYLATVSREIDEVIGNAIAFMPSARFLDKNRLEDFALKNGK